MQVGISEMISPTLLRHQSRKRDISLIFASWLSQEISGVMPTIYLIFDSSKTETQYHHFPTIFFLLFWLNLEGLSNPTVVKNNDHG